MADHRQAAGRPAGRWPAKILVIDDDRDLVRGLSVRLKAEGYEVSVAFDGGEGLELAVGNHPDAIVLDVRMPIMDGLTFLSKLRGQESVRSIPVIVVSANVDPLTWKRAMDLDAQCFLKKPYRHQDLIKALGAATGPTVPQALPVGP